jgi:hypothetical protein
MILWFEWFIGTVINEKGEYRKGKKERKTRQNLEGKTKIYIYADLVMWQPVKVARGGIESVGVRGEPTTYFLVFLE